MTQQRKITRYEGAILKIVPSPGYGECMEWRAILPGHPTIRMNDPTNATYSVKGMKWWLTYGQDRIHDYHVYERQRKAGLVRVSFWAPHEPKGVNRLTGVERMVRGRQIVRNRICLGEYTKYSPWTLDKMSFRESKAVTDARWEDYERRREELTGIPSQYLLQLKEQKQQEREQDGSISSGKEGLQA